jgi:uncharacterized Zn finger protein (UPF0148 family)
MARLKQIQCPSCGAPLAWDGKYGRSITCDYCGSVFMPAASDADAIWLMTDPVARARYEFNDTLDKLEHDIRYEVLRGGDWSALDRACLAEIDRLEKAGLLRRLASFWAISPHPSVYRALADGEFNLGGQQLPFRKGEEIVWACPMTRDRFDLSLPVLIADFNGVRVQKLCGEMADAMQGRIG